MIVYRIVDSQYANQLIASGRPGRWNLADQYVIYAASSRSLATLELLVNRSGLHPINEYKVMIIECSDSFQAIQLKNMPNDWRELSYYPQLQMLGGEWYQEGNFITLGVPSAVIPQEQNFIINTLHKDFQRKIKLLGVENYFWDKRLVV